MWPQNWTLPLFSVSHFCLSLEPTWIVVLALSVLNDIDLMFACLAKAGVVALTANAAHEYAPTIRANAVSPGMIHTGLTDILLGMDGMTEHMAAKTPLARIGTPEDIADVVVFLSSELARFVTGQNIVVDGGMTLHGAGVDGLLDRFRPFLRESS